MIGNHQDRGTFRMRAETLNNKYTDWGSSINPNLTGESEGNFCLRRPFEGVWRIRGYFPLEKIPP